MKDIKLHCFYWITEDNPNPKNNSDSLNETVKFSVSCHAYFLNFKKNVFIRTFKEIKSYSLPASAPMNFVFFTG